jgi:hypothetical protein
VVKREDVRVGYYPGCLVVVVGRVAEDGRELHPAAAELKRSSLSGQIVCFLLAEDVRFSFRHFLEQVSANVLGIGGLEKCLASVRQWFGQEGGPGVPPDLRWPFSKEPSQWLSEVNHYYLRGTVPKLTRQELEAWSVWEEQRLLNGWLTAVRGVLESPWRAYAMSRLPEEDQDPPTDLERTLKGSGSVLLAPAELERPLSAAGLQMGTDFKVFRTAADRTRLLGEADRQKSPCLLMHDPATEAPEGSASVPTVFVSQEEVRLSWGEWQRTFARNVLGAFSVPEFLSLVSENRPVWGAFGLLPLPQVFARMVDLLLATYSAIERRPEVPHKQERLNEVFRQIALCWCAQGLYFGRDGPAAS